MKTEHKAPDLSVKTGRGASKEEILAAATRVFASCGFRNTDVQEIADRLGIGKATIYRAFGTKEQLFFAAVDHGMQALNKVMLENKFNDDMEPAEKIQQTLLRFLSFFDQNEELTELLIQERSEFRDRETNSYTRNWLVNMFSSLCYGAIFTHYFSKQRIDLQSTASLMADVMTYGLLSEQTREEHPLKQTRRKVNP